MKNKSNRIFIAAVSTVYLVSIFAFIFSLVAEYRSGTEHAYKRFNSLTRDLKAISENYVPRTNEFYDAVISSMGNVSDIAGFQIKYGDELIFSYPKDIALFSKASNSLVSAHSTSMTTGSGVPVTLTASVYVLKPSSIFYKGRMAFLAILAATLASVFYLLFFVHSGDFPKESEEADDEDFEYPEIDDEESQIQEEAGDENSPEQEMPSDIEEGASSEASAALNSEEMSEIRKGLENANTEPEPEKEIPQEEKEEDVLAFLNEPAKPSADEKPVEEIPAEDESPKGLFSPVTGFSWEEYMMSRLDSELVRSASSDSDLSLFTVKIDGINWESEAGKEISSLVLEQVKFNDMIFNYKDDGFSVIYQNQNTDLSLVVADELHKMISEILSKHGLSTKVAIGISSRSLRLISGSRLANESIEALNHAMIDEDSPVVAFKVNPEKYKNFLASESFQQAPQEAAAE